MNASRQNIPIEIIRTAVAIAETGSLTRAAKKVGISQPAATSHVKRIQDIIGGSLFAKTSNGSVATDSGRLFLEQARQLLYAHDQMLQLGGLSQALQPVRLGISSIFLNDFLENQNAQAILNVTIQIDSCVGIAKSMVDSYIDVACILDNPGLPPDVLRFAIDERTEEFAWVCAPDFKLIPGKPVPILIWSSDNFQINELSRHGIAYNIIFNSRDYHAKLTAVAAGLASPPCRDGSFRCI